MKSIVLVQSLVALAVILVAAIFGNIFLFSAFAGSATVLLPNVLFAFYLGFFSKPSFVRFFMGEALKLCFMFYVLCFSICLA